MTTLMAKRRPRATFWTPTRIKRLRKAHGYDIEKAAARLNITGRQWFYLEAGTRKPSGPAVVVLDMLNSELPEENRIK